MTDKAGNRKGARAFAAAFAESVSAAMGKALDTTWPLEVMEGAEPPSRKDEPVHFRLSVDGGVQGECFIEFSQSQVTELAEKILGRPATEEEQKEELARVLAAATSDLGRKLSAEHGEVTFRVDAVSGLGFGGMYLVPLTSPGDLSGMPLLLFFDGRLLAALGAAQTTASPAEVPGVDPANLKLVMGVELNVSLRFGQRQLPLREVLELSSGSVIELDRMVDEPVELLLDGKVIARGEAVIVDGNYGLRVTEIPQPVSSHFLQ